ncbi:hypothetical protein [Legionella maioricensis]|uniref:Uncharacterized protein n=1 Tax=Legionella maioricensis TaxID=2896528 RepID=A0A9X2D2W9_9GAMM|nr:hypothetical protein [Legionella maioricensis]MCL9685569.1 hypothetical protein [Legionella maioricensis]MCL9688928.1 hypothetical protein [Legionella maioricensis]
MVCQFARQYAFYLLIVCFSASFSSLFAITSNNQQATIQQRMDDLAVFLGAPRFSSSEVNKECLPTPYDFLLVQPLMTMGIEKYYQRTPSIQLIHGRMDQKRNTYSRAIYMLLDRNKYKSEISKPKDPKQVVVELAFITINFNELSEQAIAAILNTNVPFGKILINNKINTFTEDRAYFSVKCNFDLVRLLHCRKNNIIYGRVNTLIRKDNKKWVAKVIEILPGLTCKNKDCSVLLEN